MPSGNFQFINYDISFLPEGKMTDELKMIMGMKLLNPYVESETNKNNIIEATKYFDNFYDFEIKMRNFAIEQYNSGEIELAENYFKLLVEIGSMLAVIKEYLLKIYKKNGNQQGIEWITNKIDEQLNLETDFHYQKSKLLKLKEKYSL